MKNNHSSFFAIAALIAAPLFGAQSAQAPAPTPYEVTGTIRIITDPAQCFGTLGDNERYKLIGIAAASKLGAIQDSDLCLRIRTANENSFEGIGSLTTEHLPCAMTNTMLEQLRGSNPIKLVIPTWPAQHVVTLKKLNSVYKADGKKDHEEGNFEDVRNWVVSHPRSQTNLREYSEAEAKKKSESKKDDKKA